MRELTVCAAPFVAVAVDGVERCCLILDTVQGPRGRWNESGKARREGVVVLEG
jgi:hypothetical protein